MSHLNPGLISAYNSLTDKHLAGYFSNTRIRRHLQRAGLITRSGRIVPDKEYRHKLIQRAHQRHVRECLAQAIFHKVLEMERLHQIEIKRKLEEFARRERVHKIKVERSKRYEEDLIRILSPRPPTGARGIRKQHSGPEGEHSESSESPSSSRPNTAPGKMQRPVRLKPIHSNNTTASVRRSSPYRRMESSYENDQPFNCTVDKESRRRLTTMEASRDISPYCLPVINNFVTPVPPATKRKERGLKVTHSSTIRGRRLRPTTASSGADFSEDPPVLRSSVHQSRVSVNMVYFGKTVHLSHDLTDMRDDVKVFQQHCGGENLCVYKGKLREGETFQFISRRHRGFPFSLTFFLNGLQVERLSSCCEFKHRKGSRLGGRHGHFGFSSVEGASPCYKCIIAMGLDKKPTPPPKRVKEDGGREESAISSKDAPEMETERTGEDAASHSECETSQPQDMDTRVEEETAPEEEKVRDDYEEDFEADDEGPVEDAETKEKKSPSPSSATEGQVKVKEASESEDEEKDADIRSRSGSSSSGSDREDSDVEATKESKEDEKAEQPKEVDREETVAPPDEKDKPNPEEAAATEGESAVAKDSDIQDSAGDSTEIEISDTSIPSGNENKQSEDASEEKDAGKTVEDSKQEEEQERAKSVQEKLAEAILKESQCSSEPELSDTSTEEEEESTEKGPKQDNKDAVQEKLVTATEQQQTLVEQTKCEESVESEGEVAPQHEELPETKEQKDETEQEPHENSDSTKDEKVSEVEEDEKAAEDEANAEKDQSEDTGEALHPVNEENEAQDRQTADPPVEAAAKSADAEAAEKDEEKEEKPAVEADIQPDETGQGANSREEDESSLSEQNKKTDETAAPDNAEAEAMTASETMEMKAESSEEREALSCEEAPVTDTGKRQQADSEDGAAASETQDTAENSSSLPEGSGDTAVEKTADISEENTKDESSKDDKEEAEQISGAEASKDDSQQEGCEVGEEKMEQSVETDEKIEEQKSEEEEQPQIKTDKTAEDENTEERESDEKDRTEDESKADELIDKKENMAEGTENDTNTEGKENEEDAEKTLIEEDEAANEETVKEPGRAEIDEDADCVENKSDKQESEAKGADESHVGDEGCETNTAVEEKNEEAEKSEKDESEKKAEQLEDTENKCEEKKDANVGEGGEMSEIADEPEKSADADVDEEITNISSKNITESKDVGDSEAADGPTTAEQTLSNVTEAENVKGETERASNSSEKGEIDAENGEISAGAESRPREDEEGAPAEDTNYLKTAGEEERKAEEPTEEESTDVKEVTAESGDSAEKHKDDKVDQAPATEVADGDAKEGGDGVEKQDEPTENESEPETSGAEIEEEPKLDDRKDREEDENGNKSDLANENRESDLMEKTNIENNIIEVTSSGDQEQPSAPVTADRDDTAQQLDEESKESAAKLESETDKHSHTDENVVSVDLFAADGENGADTEEASKASEEGASVLLKPQTQTSEAAEPSSATVKETPEALAKEDNTDLVTNWVNVHQSSKFFETFVEPLEDLREEEISDAQVSNSNEEQTQSRSETPLKMVGVSEDEEKAHKLKDENESRDQTRMEAVESDLGSIHAEPGEKDLAKDALQVEEKTEVKGLVPKAKTEQNESANGPEEHKGSRASLKEDKAEDGPAQGVSEENVFSTTEVESIVGTHHSAASGKPESVSENQTDEKTTDNSPDSNVKQEAAAEETKDLLPSFKTEEHHGSQSPDGVKDTNEMWEETDKPSREVTEITDLTTSKSDDGSQEESHSGETQPKVSDESVSRDRRDVRLIQDIKHTLSKDRLSTFSVDEALFGRSSYPLLTAARTESGH